MIVDRATAFHQLYGPKCKNGRKLHELYHSLLMKTTGILLLTCMHSTMQHSSGRSCLVISQHRNPCMLIGRHIILRSLQDSESHKQRNGLAPQRRQQQQGRQTRQKSGLGRWQLWRQNPSLNLNHHMTKGWKPRGRTHAMAQASDGDVRTEQDWQYGIIKYIFTTNRYDVSTVNCLRFRTAVSLPVFDRPRHKLIAI